MNPITFSQWRALNPIIENDLFYPEGINSRWARLDGKWEELIANQPSSSHKYGYTIDVETGDLFLDCRKRKIWIKFVCLIAGHPIYGAAKTAYHFFLPLSIPCEIFFAIRDQWKKNPQSTAKEIIIAIGYGIGYNLLDIIRTPMYTAAMIIISIAAVCITPFCSHILYDLRALAGRIEWRLDRGLDRWILAPCFQPIENIMTLDVTHSYTKQDTLYENDPVLHGINNLTRAVVSFRKKNSIIFDDCCRFHPQGKPYVSAIYG